jgi:hypothetical protein
LADRSTRQLLNRLARLDVLLIDELGYLNLQPEQSNIFFKLMEERYSRHSTIITTNLIYDEWHSFLGNKSMVDALLSRVRHYCHTVTIDGPSLREAAGLKMPGRVDFGAVKQAVSLEAVLRRYQVPGLRKRGPRLVGRCPIHRGPTRGFLPSQSAQKCVSLFRLPGRRQRIGFCRRHGAVFDSPGGAPVATVVFDRRAFRVRRGGACGRGNWFGKKKGAILRSRSL